MRPRKFTAVAEQITKLIGQKRLGDGSALPSQNEIAAKFKVSRSCVQKALGVLCERGIVESRPGRGVFVRKTARARRRVRSLVYIVPEYLRTGEHPLDNYGLDILLGIESGARDRDAAFVLRRYARDELGDLPSAVSRLKADGIVANSSVPDDTLEALSRLGAPVVLAGRQSAVAGVGHAVPNYYDYFHQTATRLIGDGYRRVCLLFAQAHPSGPDMRAALERVRSERKKAEISIVDYSRGDPLYDFNTADDEAVPAAVAEVLRAGEAPQVFLCNTDWIAWRTIMALQEAGLRVPEDVGVIGCLGMDLSEQNTPTISTLALDAQEMGRQAVAMLARMVERGAQPRIERVPFAFVERESFSWKAKT